MNHSAPQTKEGSVMPTCPRCQRAMTVSRIVPDQPGRETRTYHCAGCGEELLEKADT